MPKHIGFNTVLHACPRAYRQNVLYGIFPVMAGAMGITAVHYWWVMRPAKLFKNMQPGMKASKVYKLDDFNQVCGCMRAGPVACGRRADGG